MKFSLNRARGIYAHYNDQVDLVADGLDQLVERIGAQLGAVEEVTQLGDKYRGVVIAKVLSCVQHPNADKLKVCTIDDGGITPDVNRDQDGHVQVVCGAPNVRQGLTVAWLPPGATVPETADSEPFVLEARELRGVVSNGMLASPKELALSDNHDGIIELDDGLEPGSDFAETYGLKDDVIIDIENKMFTHRPDCFGYLGITRELAGIQGKSFKSPEWYNVNPEFPAIETEELPLIVKNELPEVVPRFTAVTMRDVQVGPSPVWLQVELTKVGQKSINNIVDYTNYFMLLTGQPLHVYDYDKVKALCQDQAVIVVRNPHEGEKIKLLNGKEIDPRQEAIMIATDKQLIGVGGVMGGSETEVDQDTRNIIIESANFDMYSVRRTSMTHGLFTEAVTRFNKGQSPLQTKAVLARIVDEIRQHTGGKVASAVIDELRFDESAINRRSMHMPVTVSTGFINERLGVQLGSGDVNDILSNVEFEVGVTEDSLVVKAPFWRTDIELREDVVEEVGRLYGYDKLPLNLPKRDVSPTRRDAMFDLKAEIRARLSRAGANEILTYSFVHGGLLARVGQSTDKAYEIANALSPDLQYYRMSLMPSLLDKVHGNIKAGYDEFALFEIGRAHDRDHVDNEGLPVEFEYTGLVVTAADKLKKLGAAYYQARVYLEALVQEELSFKPVGEDMKDYPVVQPYGQNRSALVSIKGGEFLGIIGEFKPSVRQALKLPKYTAGFEIDTTALQKTVKEGSSYTPLFRFPSVKQDITLKTPADLAFEQVFDFINDTASQQAPDSTHIKLSPVDIYQKEDDAEHRQITLRLTVSSDERTLTDKEINNLLDKVAQAAHERFGAERI